MRALIIGLTVALSVSSYAANRTPLARTSQLRSIVRSKRPITKRVHALVRSLNGGKRATRAQVDRFLVANATAGRHPERPNWVKSIADKMRQEAKRAIPRPKAVARGAKRQRKTSKAAPAVTAVERLSSEQGAKTSAPRRARGVKRVYEPLTPREYERDLEVAQRRFELGYDY